MLAGLRGGGDLLGGLLRGVRAADPQSGQDGGELGIGGGLRGLRGLPLVPFVGQVGE